ncbi:hypothetical protein SFC66_03675 [Terribacillus saccharophilus]|uniref:tetratricopeptide repeat protein n=1 Tax=Terribacillus saccharophilus TaxID=361277 RepID=UPI003982B4E7
MYQTNLNEAEIFAALLDELYDNIKSEQIRIAENIRSDLAKQEAAVRDEKLLARSMLYDARLEMLKDNLGKGEQLLEGAADAFELTGENLYYYHFFRGLLLYRQNRLKEAIVEFERAEAFLSEQIDYREVSDFYYKLANTYYYKKMTVFSVLNAEKAIEAALQYKQELQLAKCRLLQGLNYLEMADFQNAEGMFLAALDHDAADSELQLPLYIQHNLGVLYFRQNKLVKALDHFKKSMQYKHPEYYMKSLYYVTECCFLLGNKCDAKKYFAEGFAWSKEQDDDAYKWMFAMLYKQYMDKDSFEGVWQEGIKYFQSVQDEQNVRYYSDRLAKYYQENQDYENALMYSLLTLK